MLDKENLLQYLSDLDETAIFSHHMLILVLIEVIKKGKFDAKQDTRKWHLEKTYSYHYSTECKELHYFNDEGLKDSGFNNCPYCGLEIEEAKQ